jgi:hypothetical protein
MDALVSFGSNSEVAAIATHVCSTPNNRHVRLERTRPFGAVADIAGRIRAANSSPTCSRRCGAVHLRKPAYCLRVARCRPQRAIRNRSANLMSSNEPVGALTHQRAPKTLLAAEHSIG